jgi:XTP/dITP diphosphohydrolase
MRDRLLFVSSNPGKVREVEAILGAPVEQLALDVPEIQALDVAEVAREKARAAFARVGRPVMVEDTGLYLDALSGLPGAFVRWFLLTIGPAGISALIPPGAERGATARTAVALCDGETTEVFTGETRGEIVPAPRGAGGFGWDVIFLPDGATKTFAEMDQAEKNVSSMRRLALERSRERLIRSR